MEVLPDIAVSKGSGPGTAKPKVTRYTFGDGYTQRTKNGLNPISHPYNAVWQHLSQAERDILVNFFESLSGVTAFYWTPPLESNLRKYTCAEWLFTPQPGDWYTGTATFTEEFDL